MTAMPMGGQRASALIQSIESQLASMPSPGATRLVVRCPDSRSAGAERLLAGLEETLELRASPPEVGEWEVQEAIDYAVQSVGVSNVYVWGHSECERGSSEPGGRRSLEEARDPMARLVDRFARHRESLASAKDDVRAAVATLESELGEHASVFGMVEIAESGCLLGYDPEADVFRAID